jgi:hypothetical protein
MKAKALTLLETRCTKYFKEFSTDLYDVLESAFEEDFENIKS